jgi:hypothetical protein
MITAETILQQEKYKELKNLVLICEAMDDFAKIKVNEQRLLMSTHLNMRNVPTPRFVTDEGVSIARGKYYRKEGETEIKLGEKIEPTKP